MATAVPPITATDSPTEMMVDVVAVVSHPCAVPEQLAASKSVKPFFGFPPFPNVL